MKLSFRGKVILGIAIIELTMFSLLIMNDLRILSGSHREMMLDTIETTLSGFQSSTINAVASIDTATLDELTGRLAATPTVKYVLIENPDNQILSIAEDEPGLAANAKMIDTDLASTTSDTFRDKALVESGGMHIGTIYIGFDIRKIKETQSWARNQALRIAMLGLFLSAVFSYILGSILSQRLRALQHGAERIAQTDYSDVFDESGNDELAEVGRAFNIMTKNLKAEKIRSNNFQQELRHMNMDLEDRVKQRTEELSHANARLQETITTLKQAQSQLLQSEKMASIGQLAAGVAHEINNPVGYINSNIHNLNEYVRDLVNLLNTYIEHEHHIQEEHARSLLEKLRNEIDIDFLLKDIMELLGESEEGLERVKKIVADLKQYSRSDSGKLEMTDIHKGINSTLNIANNEIKYKADVVKEFGDIPPLPCHISQLNQVFMNIIINAAQSIERAPGIIRIRTQQHGDEVCIIISDNGKGIDPENVSRIFDPFFTTKPVGQGTGLGLSLSYNIVEKHNGRIEVNSTPGKGTEFKIWLPIKPANSELPAG